MTVGTVAFEHPVLRVYGKLMLWKMWCFALQSMSRTNHKFPIYATHNVRTQLKSTVHKVHTEHYRMMELVPNASICMCCDTCIMICYTCYTELRMLYCYTVACVM